MNEELKVLLSSLKHIQEIQTNKMFRIYNYTYKSILKKFFKISAVSINFRLKLKNEYKNYDLKKKQKIKGEILTFLNNDKNYLNEKIMYSKMLDISKLEAFIINKNYGNLFDTDIMFIKRAVNQKDRFSGNIAFPGGKMEKYDRDDLDTAIRETQEEINLNFNSNEPVISRYICPNISFDVPFNLKYYVSSHIFIIFDVFSECDNHLKPQETEIANILFVPISYFTRIDKEKESKIIKQFKQKTFGNEVQITKLILNEDENFLLYGMTLRKLLVLLNIKTESIKYKEKMEFNSKYKNIAFEYGLRSLKFLVNPYKSYLLFKNSIYLISLFIFIYYTWNCLPRSKF